MIKGVTHAHIGSIWYHSEPSDVPFFPNQFLDLDFFCHFLQPSVDKHFSLNHVIVRHTAIIKDHWKASGLFYVLALQRMYLNNFGRSDDDII